MNRNRPHITALADQLHAATADARQLFTALADQIGAQPVHTPPTPAVDTILTRLHNRLRAGRVTLCPHLSQHAPAPAWWPAWAPGRIRCPHCTTRAGQRIKNTTEDRTCDACRHIEPAGLYDGAILLPACLADLPGFLGVWPPITVLFGLCTRCKTAQQDTTQWPTRAAAS